MCQTKFLIMKLQSITACKLVLISLISCILFHTPQTVRAQNGWSTGKNYLQRNEVPLFLSGVNFIPSTGWLMVLENWNPEAVEEDIKTLSEYGIKVLRFAPLWHIVQPLSTSVDETIVKRIDQIVNLAEEYDVYLQIAPITGWMSGGTFLPDWATGNIFTDPDIIKGEVELIQYLTERYKNNPHVMGYDFGNEIEALYQNMHLECTPGEIHSWLGEIYEAFDHSPDIQPITNGISYYDKRFDTWVVSRNSDYMSIHYYPYFAGTYKLDPWIGMRTTYGPNYLVAWTGMTGKPVLVQELGMSEAWLPRRDIPRYLELTYLSSWADGACGYFWWCSHDIDRNYRVKTEGLHTEFSVPVMAEGNFHELEYELGLFTIHNQPKPSAYAFREITKIVDNLGTGWADLLPVCYILVPESATGDDNMIQLLQPFVLAKQAHMDVKLCPEGSAIPTDADVLVIAGFSLSETGRQNVYEFMEKGGTVYQSNFKDFSHDITAHEQFIDFKDPMPVVHETLGKVQLGDHINFVQDIKIRKVDYKNNVKVLIRIPEKNEPIWKNRFEKVRGLMFMTSEGNGTYYYLAADLENALIQTYDPWDYDDSDVIYRLIRPETKINIDSKFVELYHKEKNGRQIAILLNHKDDYVNCRLTTTDPYVFRNALTGTEMGKGSELNLILAPAGFQLIYLERL